MKTATNARAIQTSIQHLPIRKVQRDLTIMFGGRLYSLANLGKDLCGAYVRVTPVNDSDSISVEIKVDGYRGNHVVQPLAINEYGFRQDAVVLGGI